MGRDYNADEWHLFLCEHLDNRATSPNGLTFMAVQIAEALDAAREGGRQERDRVWRRWLEDLSDGGPAPDVPREPDIDYGRGPGFDPNDTVRQK